MKLHQKKFNSVYDIHMLWYNGLCLCAVVNKFKFKKQMFNWPQNP